MSGIQERLLSALREDGFQGAVVSVEHVAELQAEIKRLLSSGVLDQGLYQVGLSWFRFSQSSELVGAQSLIVIALPEPIIQLQFQWQGEERQIVIPPIYSPRGTDRLQRTLEDVLGREQYYFERAGLPLKLLAVRSGLAAYGRNNISYVNGFGSYHRLVAFISDMPCEQDSWREPERMAACDDCQACVHACPTECIKADRTVIHAERCITYFNEAAEPFPDWLDAHWHNALIGCMRCQGACPENRGRADVVQVTDAFTEQEIDLMQSGTAFDELPQSTRATLESLGQTQAYRDRLISRNLAALLAR